MSLAAKNTTATIIPAMRYRDAPAAIEWLCKAFGFKRHAVYEDGEGGIAHAQLRYGNGMIMLGSIRHDEWGQMLAQPDENGGRETQSAYVVVADPDAHYANALAHGATVAMPIQDNDYGGRGYGLRDSEGHLWSFGSYDPWADDNA